MIHVSKESAAHQVSNAMINAEKADKFMVAVWSVGENGELSCHRTTWQFPTDRLEEAVRQLGKMVREEIRPTSVPLPLASFLRPDPVSQFPEDFKEQIFSQLGVPPAIFKGEARPIEQDETVSDLPGAFPIVNAVLPLDSEDGE